MLELRDICKTYIQGKMEVPVLKNVSLSVEEGEYLAIMGPSGSGKTTLMNVIGCLDTPTSGEYYLEGRDLSGESDLVLSRARLHSIGFVFQSFHLLPRQSALENVALPLLYAGVRKKERLERARHALERVGLGDRMNFKPTQLSGGQCQRVAIARAIVNNPKILLADEPTGALDTASGEQIMEVFERLNNEGVTIVMITHEQQIASHAQRILYIRDGQLTDMPGRFSTAAQKIAPAAQELAPVAQVPEEAVSDDIAEETPAESVRKPLPVVIVHPFEKEEEKISPEERSSEEALSELSLNKAESTDTFLDTEISALLDNGGESRDAGENIPEQVSAESIPLAVPAEESAEEAPSEETPTLVDRPTKSGAPAQISFDIWADPKEEFDTAAAEFTEEVELEATEKPVEKSSVKEKKSTRKKSATLVEIEDINVGFDTGEPETAAPAQEEKPVEEPKKNLKNSPSENSRKKSAKLVEIEDINVGFDTGEPETVAPAQE
ncbi:MAG: ATP-binding cassette domain-containing protein, partial [Acutalibacter sp.]|nr:ATP-binding cassette domain-containing protein [Acutalibacter sp.]